MSHAGRGIVQPQRRHLTSWRGFAGVFVVGVAPCGVVGVFLFVLLMVVFSVAVGTGAAPECPRRNGSLRQKLCLFGMSRNVVEAQKTRRPRKQKGRRVLSWKTFSFS